MDVASPERKDLAYYLTARSVRDFAQLTPDQQREEFLGLAPLLYPILEALPEDCTEAMLDEGEVDFSHAAAVSLVMIGKEIARGQGVSDEEIASFITVEARDAMAHAHLNFAKLLIQPIRDFIELQAAVEADPDAELAKLLDSE